MCWTKLLYLWVRNSTWYIIFNEKNFNLITNAFLYPREYLMVREKINQKTSLHFLRKTCTFSLRLRKLPTEMYSLGNPGTIGQSKTIKKIFYHMFGYSQTISIMIIQRGSHHMINNLHSVPKQCFLKKFSGSKLEKEKWKWLVIRW